MLVLMRFQFLRRVLVIVRPVLARVLMVVHMVAVSVFVFMLVCVPVNMAMRMSMGMGMGCPIAVRVNVRMGVRVLVLVFAFHVPTSQLTKMLVKVRLVRKGTKNDMSHEYAVFLPQRLTSPRRRRTRRQCVCFSDQNCSAT